MRFLARSFIGIFLLAVTAALFAWAGNTVRLAVEDRMNAEPRAFPRREQVISVNVVPIEPQTVTPVLETFGELQSARSLAVRARVGGTIVEVAEDFVEGGHVQAGQLLLRIDPTDAQAALDRAATDLADAEAEVREAERALALDRDELAAAEEQKALRDQALARQQDLRSRGVSTASDLEAAELAASSAAQAVLSARQAVDNSAARVDQAATALARARISLAEAERTLADTRITARFTGTLSAVGVTEGGLVSQNEQVATLIEADRLEATFRVSAAQYARLLDDTGRLIDAPLTASLAVQGIEITTPGRIAREGAEVGEGLTGRLLFATLDSAAGFRPGDFVTLRVQEPALSGVARVPATALGPDMTVLVLGEDNRLISRTVTLERRQGDDVLIRAPGLEGRWIVAERSPLLGEGLLVQPVDPNAAPAEPEMIALDPERRARLLAFVEGSQMPDAVKANLTSQLQQDEVPADTVSRIEARMGS